jgi:hypothetical protein
LFYITPLFLEKSGVKNRAAFYLSEATLAIESASLSDFSSELFLLSVCYNEDDLFPSGQSFLHCLTQTDS